MKAEYRIWAMFSRRGLPIRTALELFRNLAFSGPSQLPSRYAPFCAQLSQPNFLESVLHIPYEAFAFHLLRNLVIGSDL